MIRNPDSMQRLLRLALILSAALPVTAAAGCPDSTGASDRPLLSIVKDDGLSFLRMAGYVFSAPARWDGGDWLTAGAAGAGTAAASLLDNDVRSLAQRNHSQLNNGISDVGVEYGSGLNMLVLSAAGYSAGLVFEDTWLRQTALLSGTAIIFSGTLSTLSKVIAGRARPYVGKGKGEFRPISFTAGYESLPSGHTIVAFALTGVLAERIKNPWASVGLYGLAAATGFSRIYTDDHWFSDVVFGAVISIAVSRSLVRWYEGEGGGGDEHGLRIVPTGNGIALLWTF